MKGFIYRFSRTCVSVDSARISYGQSSMINAIEVLTENTYGKYNNSGGYPAQCKPRKGGHDSAQSQRILTIYYLGKEDAIWKWMRL